MALYLDNAATTFPKPKSVYEAVRYALEEVGANPGRASHRKARQASSIVSETRAKVARLFDIAHPERIVFTKNATESLNIAIKGWLRPGDRVLISSMEHNSVVRPLMRLEQQGVRVEQVRSGATGLLDLEDLARRFDRVPRLVALNHASNVNGLLQPVFEVSRLCSEHGVPLLLDAAQTAGIQSISVNRLNLGMLACSGHKALLGPPGTGILYINPELDVLPLMEGGTGSLSESEVQPVHSPDRFESGSMNLPGIAGLNAGIEFILEEGIEKLLRHELGLASQLERGLADVPGVTVYCPAVRGTGVVSFSVEGVNPSDVAFMLDEVFDIAVRSGLHCAPLAHRTLGTFPEGTVRVSPGYSTTSEEIDFFLSCLGEMVSYRR